MILPIANVVSGFVLSVPKLKEWFSKGSGDITTAESALNKYRTPLGVIILLLGLFGLIKRMSLFGIMYEWSWHYGSSFPQSIIAILMGLILLAHFFARWPALHARIMQLEKYGDWLGILGILVGFGSLI